MPIRSVVKLVLPLAFVLSAQQIYANSSKPPACIKVVGIEKVLSLTLDSDIVSSPEVQARSFLQMIENAYGPLTAKPETIGFNWKEAKENLISEARAVESTNDLYFLFANFLARFNDAHISFTLPSSLEWKLPLFFEESLNRAFFAGIEKADYPAGVRVPEYGDELLTINGQNLHDFHSQFPTLNASGNALTNFGFFIKKLSHWSESRGLPLSILQYEKLKLGMKSKKTGELYFVELDLSQKGVGLIGRDIALDSPAPQVVIPKSRDVKKDEALSLALLTKLTGGRQGTIEIAQMAHKLIRTQLPGYATSHSVTGSSMASRPRQDSKIEIGSPTPFFQLPADFKPIKAPFFGLLKSLMGGDVMTAGTFQRNGKTIGFIRVGSYSVGNLMFMELALRRTMGILNKMTDTLILDQTNNPGGYVIFADLLLKSLTGKFDESKHLRFAVKPNQSFLRMYAELRNSIERNEDKVLTKEEVSYFVAKLDAEYKKIYAAFIAGKPLSEPISMMPISEYFALTLGDKMLNHPVKRRLAKIVMGPEVLEQQHFQGRVMMLCNHYCFSGGDAFPAMFQDYGRGETYGTRTAGAGGSVDSHQLTGMISATLSLTSSLMVRPNGSLVENYGVTPQIPFQVLPEDIETQYSQFFERFLKEIKL